MYTIRHLHFRVRAEKEDTKIIWGRKCLPVSDLKSSIHLAYHKENREMLWPWHIKIPSRGKKSFKEFFYPVKKAKPDTRAGSWRQIQIRKKNHIFTLWFHYPSEMADLHVLMPSRMTDFLDKHNSTIEWPAMHETQQQCLPSPLHGSELLLLPGTRRGSWPSCTMLLLLGWQALLLYPGALTYCVRALKRGISNLLQGSKILLHFHILCHSKTSSLPQGFQSSLKAQSPIFPPKMFLLNSL